MFRSQCLELEDGILDFMGPKFAGTLLVCKLFSGTAFFEGEAGGEGGMRPRKPVPAAAAGCQATCGRNDWPR